MEQVESIAAQHGARRVESISLRIGPLSGVEPVLLENAFPLAATGTVAEGARLEISRSDVVVVCSQCSARSTVLPNRLVCGVCGDFRTRLESGDEMLLASLELMDVSPPPGEPEAAGPES
jgi:hydrogenase nickel incorporation protein HypA/HybF